MVAATHLSWFKYTYRSSSFLLVWQVFAKCDACLTPDLKCHSNMLPSDKECVARKRVVMDIYEVMGVGDDRGKLYQ